jgi:hypothetical protein
MKGLDNIDYNRFFQLADCSRTRGHRYKIVKIRSRVDVRGKFFSQRVVNSWNRLPESVVEAQTVNMFKSRLDRYWEMNDEGEVR